MSTFRLRRKVITLAALLMAFLACPTLLHAQGVVFVENNNVGIRVATPSRPLEIDATGDANSNVVLLKRDGALRYRMENTTANSAWDFAVDGPGRFAVQKVGIAKNMMTVIDPGRLAIGCGTPDHDLVLSPGPGCSATPRSWIDMGSTSFSTSSSIFFKENLALVDSTNILEKMAGVHVYTYDFKNGPADRLGLVAEEFHEIFHRGSDQELSGQEIDMALWLGVQELAHRNEELERQNQALEERLQRLEALLLQP